MTLAAVLARLPAALVPPVRLAAVGFHAQLADIVARAGADDCDELRQLLAELDAALDGDSPAESLPVEPAAPSLATRCAETPIGRPLLAKLGPDPSPAALYLLTWQLAPDAAATWRREWLAEYPAAGVGSEVAGPFDAPLIPGVAALSAGTPIEPRLSTGDPLTTRLARTVAAAIWFAKNDPSLMCCLQSVYRFGFAPLRGALQARVVATLTDRLERFAEAERSGKAGELLPAFVAVDEAVHSLVHQPLAHPRSDYARLGQACRALLPEVCGDAHAQAIAGGYSNALRYTDKADLEGDGVGAAGDVIHCCRLYSVIGGAAAPGRVVYKPR